MPLELSQDVVTFKSGDRPWSFSVADLRIIAEFTNDYGPFLDDWFVVFVMRGGSWHEAAVDDSVIDVLMTLAPRLGVKELAPIALCGSTSLASHVMWPAALAGQPLFRYPWWWRRRWNARLKGAMAGETGAERRVLTQAAAVVLGS